MNPKRISSANCILPVIGLLAFGMALGLTVARGDTYNLGKVKGIHAFNGSEAARKLLEKNGFVVTDPAFKQIFEPYIRSPMSGDPSASDSRDDLLPAFITVDSAWHTYHVIFEEGVKELEEFQCDHLAGFSKALVASARQNSLPEIASYASIGLALQDPSARNALSSGEKSIVESLLSGSANVAVPIGFELSPLQFRAQSFYTQSPELSAYFAARQWYGGVVFRLADSHETDLALKLATLVNSDTNLFAQWKQLTEPYDSMLSLPEDGTVPIYAAARKAGATDKVMQKLRDTVPSPLISDQQLSPDDYSNFGQSTRGFRLLPPRSLPCSICFHKSTDPAIPGRAYPSGLDFMVSSPVLRSPAAIRAAQSQFGQATVEALLKIDASPLPDSLYGESMKLLSQLQQAPPNSVAPVFRTPAWNDLQLWTQLSGWAEQRHTWALHAKLTVFYNGITDPPPGIVAPYPGFFAGLAKLSRDSANALRKAGYEGPFDPKAVAVEMMTQMSKPQTHLYDEEAMSRSGNQFSQFFTQFYSEHEKEMAQSTDQWEKTMTNLQTMAARVAQTGGATSDDIATLKLFYNSRVPMADTLSNFAGTCDRLADLATKCRDGRALSPDDAEWIRKYGETLANYHFYYGNSYDVPLDNFPIATRVYSNPLKSAMFYAGLTRPKAIYLIANNQLYRGAVMTYREFVRPDNQLLDDDSWRDLVSKGQEQPAPAFTKSFCPQRSLAEWMEAMNAVRLDAYQDRQEILSQLSSSATESDLPALIKLMESSAERDPELLANLAHTIAFLPCQQYEIPLLKLLSASNAALGDASAFILTNLGAKLDTAPIVASFDKETPRVQRLRLVVLQTVATTNGAAANVIFQALKNTNDGVRWQAVQALLSARLTNSSAKDALLASLKDTNVFVAENAARGVSRLGETNACENILAELKLRVAHPPSDDEEQSQLSAVSFSDGYERSKSRFSSNSNILDPDGQLGRVDFVMRRRAPNLQRVNVMAINPRVVDFMQERDFDALDRWIQLVGTLKCPGAEEYFLGLLSGDRRTAAFSALQKLGSQRLLDQTLAAAIDSHGALEIRVQALIDLSRLNATNQLCAIVPLLDDKTPIPGTESPRLPARRICDCAAQTIAILRGEGRNLPLLLMRDPDELIARLKNEPQMGTDQHR